MMQVKECTPTLYSFIVSIFELAFEYFKEFGVTSNMAFVVQFI
jgi:hypothetical protein